MNTIVVMAEIAKIEILTIEPNRVRVAWNNTTTWIDLGTTFTLSLPVTLEDRGRSGK